MLRRWAGFLVWMLWCFYNTNERETENCPDWSICINWAIQWLFSKVLPTSRIKGAVKISSLHSSAPPLFSFQKLLRHFTAWLQTGCRMDREKRPVMVVVQSCTGTSSLIPFASFPTSSLSYNPPNAILPLSPQIKYNLSFAST